MSTVTTTGSTAGTTTATSTAKVNSGTTKQLLDSLGSGSGVDTAGLVTSLVDAQFAAKKAQLTAKGDALTAQISGVATLKNTITEFTRAFEALVKGGTLATQPVSSDTGKVSASVIPGAVPSQASTSVTVTRLATAQTATSTKVADPKTTTFGTGRLTLAIGSVTGGSFAAGKDADGADTAFDIAVDEGNNTLSGIAAAINAKKAGVTATIVTDADGGAFLALKGQTGAAQAFQLTASDATGTLADLEVRPAGGASAGAMSVSGRAGNAELTVDGVSVQRAANEIADLVPGVKLNLAATGTVTLSATRQTTALTNAVNDFVDTFNQVLAQVKEQTDSVSGQLRTDPAARTLLRTLQKMTNQVLVPGAAAGTPTTLASIGVRTARDGTLSVDSAALTSALATAPDAVEAMFAMPTTGASGLYSELKSLDLNTSSTLYGLGASTRTYQSAQKALTTQQGKIDDQSSRLSTRLTQQFASMNTRVSAYKATQSFMKQQIDAWAKSS